MIRRFEAGDLTDVMALWLEGNLSAHDFIPGERWEQAYDEVASVLPGAEVFIYEEDRMIRGFIGITDGNYIAGLFVDKAHRAKGIGRQLLSHCKRNHASLCLDVFAKNSRAVAFYENNGFQMTEEKTNPDFGEREYRMQWMDNSVL